MPMNKTFNPWQRLKVAGKFTLVVGLLLILIALITLTNIRQANDLLNQPQTGQPAAELQQAQAQLERTSYLVTALLVVTVSLAVLLAGLIILGGRWMQANDYMPGGGNSVDFTRRKQREDLLRQQNDYLNVLHETTIALIKHLNLNELLVDIISRAGELLGTPHGYLYLVEPGQLRIERKIGVGLYGDQPAGFYLLPGEGLAGKVWQSGRPMMVNDCPTWGERSSRANYETIQAMAAVPLKSGEEVIGVIGMAYDIHTGQVFDEKELELLTRFAELASLALNNARLYRLAQQEKERSDNLLNVVIPIGVALSAEQNFDRLLEKILLEAKHFCHADAGTLYLRTETDELNFVIVCNDTLNIRMGGTSGVAIDFPPVPLYDKVTGQPNHNNVAAYVALTGQSINIPDAYQAEGFNFSGTRVFDERTGYRSTSFLTTPLKNAHTHVVGVLQLINAKAPATREIVPFDHALEQIATSLSSLATVALEAYIREQSLRQQIRQLRIEIDEAKRQKQVDEIVETDFFQDLQHKARQIRHRIRRERLKDQNPK